MTLLWPPPPPDWAASLPAARAEAAVSSAKSDSPAGREVHLWALRLDPAPDALVSLATFLSADEQARAARFHFERHRHRFIAGRAMLRQMLAEYAHVSPQSLEFGTTPAGKPFLTNSAKVADLHFNLSHSDTLALLAVSREGPVGVDVERVRTLNDASELVTRFFSARENAEFQQVAEAEQPAAFFRLWTRKEAWLKAVGEGIGRLLPKVEVSFLSGEDARFVSLPEEWRGQGDWSLHALEPATGFVGALAVPFRAAVLRLWQWPAGS